MGKNQSASGLTNIIQYDNNGNVSFVSGSTTLMQISSSGAITTTGVISGSNALSSSYSLNSGLLNETGSVGFATTASLLTVSSSQQQISASQQQLSSSFLILTASFNAVSASQQQISASYIALSASYNTFSGSASTRITENSSSIQQISSSQQQISSSLLNVISIFATTGSNSFRATQSITGSLTVTGQIIAQTLNVQQVTSSIIYSSGSNNFGCDLNSRQTFTGSVLITGSLTIAGASSATSYSGTTIYGSTAVCSPVGKFTTCIDAGSGTFSDNVLISKANLLSSLTIKSSCSTTGLQLYLYGQNATLSNQDNGSLVFQTNGADRLTITSTGAATFACQVCVGGDIKLDTGAADAQIILKNNASGNPRSIAYNVEDASISFNRTSGGAGATFFNSGVACFANTICLPTSNTSLVAGTYGTISNVGGIDINIGNNAYYDGTNWRRFAAQEAARIYINRNSFSFLRKASDGAGSCISWDDTLFLASSGIACFASTVCSPMFLASGCVGIGTTLPQHKLDIQNGNLGIYHNTNVGGGASGAQIYLGDSNFQGGVYACSAPGIGAVCSPSTAVAGDLAFYAYTGTAACRSEKMRILGGGNVGIGATAPSSLLHICGAGTGAMLRLQNTTTVSGDQGPRIQFMSANQVGNQDFETGYIQSIWQAEGNAFSMRFATKGVDASQSEKMRIFYGGQVAINRTDSGAGALGIRGLGSTDAANAFYVDNSNTSELFSVRNDGVIRTGTIAGSPYNNTSAQVPNLYVSSGGTLERGTSSSMRYKENIIDWEGSGINTILALKPKTFKYKKDYYHKADIDFLGLIAEEVAEVSPYLADYENEDRTGQVENVRYANIVTPLIKAVQEQQCTICSQAAMINTLKTCLGIA